MPSQTLPATAKKNVETIAKVEQQLLGQRSRIDYVGEVIARYFGNLWFIVAHCLFFGGWFVLNLGHLATIRPFDPYPFPFLGLIVGIEFIFLTTFVLMNQNLQSKKEEHWAHLNLQLSMLAEHEVTKNMQMLQLICQHLGIEKPNRDHEVKDLTQATSVTTLVEEIAQKLGGGMSDLEVQDAANHDERMNQQWDERIGKQNAVSNEERAKEP